MQVILLPEVLDYLEELVEILYEMKYFSFEKNAMGYVLKLYDDITTSLSTKYHRPAPKYFDKYGKGMKYAVFRKNRRTSWYVFFTTYRENDDDIFLVRYIANNHVIAKYL